MLTVAIMVAGAVAVVVAWRVVVLGFATVWVALSVALGAAALASLATGRVSLSPRVSVLGASLAGLGLGVLLYMATVAFVLVVRRWPVFDRHVAEIYDQRKGLPLGPALLVAAAVVAPSEEVFWRGLFQARLGDAVGWPVAAALTWVIYVVANAASESLPILAGAVVSGAVWGALALWTHGVLAGILCHSSWTALMLAWPPGGPARRDRAHDAGKRSRR
jgi:membrane protease YdiL (CAAX protease family)